MPYSCLRFEEDFPIVLIFAAILAIFVYGMTAAMLGTILPDLSERFHLTPAQNGTIAFAQALGLMIASLASVRCWTRRATRSACFLGSPASLWRCSRCRERADSAPLSFCCFCWALAEASS